jgi:putative transposase
MALDALENQVLLDTLNSERFVDTAPAAVHATLLDEGSYLGSVRTMYRLLARTGGSRERRNQLVHPAYTKPELLAIAPNQVGQVDVLPPVRDPGYLQPLCRGVADRPA